MPNTKGDAGVYFTLSGDGRPLATVFKRSNGESIVLDAEETLAFYRKARSLFAAIAKRGRK